MFKKYAIPFVISLVVFAFAGFNPLDCAEPGTEKSCSTPHFSNLEECSWNGIELKGKIKFVESFPDIKIQMVQSFPDLNVKFVESFPDDCGEWQVVESFPDFKVQIVESFPDVKVKIVESFPGIP